MISSSSFVSADGLLGRSDVDGGTDFFETRLPLLGLYLFRLLDFFRCLRFFLLFLFFEGMEAR